MDAKQGDSTTSALALRGAQAWFQVGLERGNSALEVDRIAVFALQPRGAVLYDIEIYPALRGANGC